MLQIIFALLCLVNRYTLVMMPYVEKPSEADLVKALVPEVLANFQKLDSFSFQEKGYILYGDTCISFKCKMHILPNELVLTKRDKEALKSLRTYYS